MKTKQTQILAHVITECNERVELIEHVDNHSVKKIYDRRENEFYLCRFPCRNVFHAFMLV